ncbi:MAG: hypothetical protein J6D47_19825 [Peptostreptococcaceae bacterium]|nr:hypothetical protein [Peptostreptococcaceae bacterium]
MEFKIMQFNAYIDTLNKYLKETNSKKKEKLINELELIKNGLIPVKYLMK